MSVYGNNITISYPGPDWELLWPESFGQFQLDIVGFLAILGESSILANAQVSALSKLFLVPRLLPAPQALLRVSRPATLPPENASVVSVKSGNKKDHLHHVANILLQTSSGELEKYGVRCVKVTKASITAKKPSLLDRYLRGVKKPAQEGNGDKGFDRASVKAKAAGPLTWVTLLGIALTLTIIIASIVYGDGMSFLAAVALSLLSCIAGIANKWELSLVPPPNRSKKSPEDMVVIRYPEGSFLVVRCNDEVARELFFAPEEISYWVKSSHIYRLLALVGSILLMLGVILLANARLQLQLAWAGSYLLLNAAHWAAAALPARMHWDLDCYKLEEEGIEGGPDNDSFMEALWKVILVTKRHEWVRFGGAAPNTKAWDEWARDAAQAARRAPPEIDSEKLQSPCRTWPGWSRTGKMHNIPRDKLGEPIFNARAAFIEKAIKFSKEEAEREERDLREMEEFQEANSPVLDSGTVLGAPRPEENGHAS